MDDRSFSAWEVGLDRLPGCLPDVDRRGMEATEGLAPVFAERGKGSRFWDVRAREYIDYVMAWGALILGYGNPAVEEAVREQLARGITFSIAAELQIEVAERLTRIIPCAEQVYFGKNGSDACTAAVRMARVATRRDGIAVCRGHFHGFHDWFACSLPAAAGIPGDCRNHLYQYPYNDLESLSRLLKKRGNRIAAVMLEPVRDVEPEKEYLEELVRMAHRSGCLVIFDEMVTGFRLANGGAQEVYGAIPDLACFGKSVANGLPLSFVCGTREWMRHGPSVFAQMTFQFEQLSLAAARAVLGELEREPVAPGLREKGARLREGLLAAARECGIDLWIGGPPARQTLGFPSGDPAESKRRLTYFLQGLMARGIFTNGNFLPSAAHTDEDIRITVERSGEALRDVSDGIRENDLARRIRFPFPIV